MLIYNGLLSTDLHWREWIAHYRERYTLVTWDYRGHGASPPPRDPSTVRIPQHADDAHALVEELGLAPAIVCGLSFGVQAALEHWRRHPGDVRALVLLCGTFGHPLARLSSSQVVRRAALAYLRLLARGGRVTRAALGPLLRSGLVHQVTYLTGGADRATCPRAVLDELFEHIVGMDIEVACASVATYLDHSAEDALATVAVPTMIVAGGADQLTPPSLAEEMHRRIAGSALHIVAGHAHLAQVEAPAEVHGVVDRFLDERDL